jgi:hypothetical protein
LKATFASWPADAASKAKICSHQGHEVHKESAPIQAQEQVDDARHHHAKHGAAGRILAQEVGRIGFLTRERLDCMPKIMNGAEPPGAARPFSRLPRPLSLRLGLVG